MYIQIFQEHGAPATLLPTPIIEKQVTTSLSTVENTIYDTVNREVSAEVQNSEYVDYLINVTIVDS